MNPFEIDQSRLEAAAHAVSPLADNLGLEEQVQPYLSRCWLPQHEGATQLHVDDFSGIPFLVDIVGVEDYQHRARLRAVQGDVYVAVTPPTPGYERYCGRWLGLEPVEMVIAKTGDNPLALSRNCMQGEAWTRLVDIARSCEHLVVHPFMGVEDVWELAAALTQETRTPASVLAPPPPVTWLANDKALFGRLVESVLGSGWLVPNRLVEHPADMVDGLRELARRHPRVALKRLRCASAMGNRVFDSARLLELRHSTVYEEVESFLVKTEWNGRESVLVVAWENCEHSPSTQLWIPPRDHGPVRVQGVYEQLLEGERKVFVGSRPSTLPNTVNETIAGASVLMGTALQSLGYVGRCSFDFIVTGDPEDEFAVKVTECNGRWGGTSTPMALVDRLFEPPRPFYRARDYIHPGLAGAAFEDLLTVVGNELWDHRTRRGSFLFYNTGPLRAFGKLDVIALGGTQADADEALEETLPRLLGLV